MSITEVIVINVIFVISHSKMHKKLHILLIIVINLKKIRSLKWQRIKFENEDLNDFRRSEYSQIVSICSVLKSYIISLIT